MAAEAELRRDALRIFSKALEAADAANAVRRHFARSESYLRAGELRFDLQNYDRISLVAIGKAAVPMGRAIEDVMGDDLDRELAITKYGHASNSLRNCIPIEAGHPVPDQAGEKAAQFIESLVRPLEARDLLIVAVSGGASALLPAPAFPVTLAAKQQTTELLLKAGANIRQLNAVRKHLSFLKGGRLAALAYPATVLGLLLSDVIGDPLDVIGSGPIAPDSSTFAEAITVLKEFELLDQVPEVVRSRLERGAAGRIEETPKPGDPIFRNVHNIIVGSNQLALEAAASEARELGYRTLILSSSLEGETCEIASSQAQMLREIAASGRPISAPACILSGGETTVTVRGAGQGGRNQEFALAAAPGIAGLDNVAVLSAGTDGTDGPTDAAGAIATGRTIARAHQLGLSVAGHLANNDSYWFFEKLGDLIRTGPTGTNVMDIHVMLAG